MQWHIAHTPHVQQQSPLCNLANEFAVTAALSPTRHLAAHKYHLVATHGGSRNQSTTVTTH